MQAVLFMLGLILFLVGLLTGFAVPALKNPRMALSSHLEAVLNGMFLVLLGLLWPHIHLPNAWAVTAIALIVYSAYANWLTALLAAVGCRAQIRADRDRRPSGLSGKGARRQCSVGVPLGGDRGRRDHRHRRTLKDSL
jgi:hypothetical protein